MFPFRNYFPAADVHTKFTPICGLVIFLTISSWLQWKKHAVNVILRKEGPENKLNSEAITLICMSMQVAHWTLLWRSFFFLQFETNKAELLCNTYVGLTNFLVALIVKRTKLTSSLLKKSFHSWLKRSTLGYFFLELSANNFIQWDFITAVPSC